jgi:hypothetical protein
MSIELIVLVGISAVTIALVLGLLYRHMPKRLRHETFVKKWRDLQAVCRDKVKWPDALINADNLLDSALKRRKFKGKTMGERLVSAQRIFQNNDEVWFAHNLAKKIVARPEFNLKESDVKAALIAFRQALRDLNALPPFQQQQSQGKGDGESKS